MMQDTVWSQGCAIRGEVRKKTILKLHCITLPLQGVDHGLSKLPRTVGLNQNRANKLWQVSWIDLRSAVSLWYAVLETSLWDLMWFVVRKGKYYLQFIWKKVWSFGKSSSLSYLFLVCPLYTRLSEFVTVIAEKLCSKIYVAKFVESLRATS